MPSACLPRFFPEYPLHESRMLNNNDKCTGVPCSRGNLSSYQHGLSSIPSIPLEQQLQQQQQIHLISRDLSNRRVRQHDGDISHSARASRPAKRSRRSDALAEAGAEEQEEKISDTAPSAASLVDIVVKLEGTREQTSSRLRQLTDENTGDTSLRVSDNLAFDRVRSSNQTIQDFKSGTLYTCQTSQQRYIPSTTTSSDFSASTVFMPGYQHPQTAVPSSSATSSQPQSFSSSFLYTPIEVGARQQYLQGYLSGLHQATRSTNMGMQNYGSQHLSTQSMIPALTQKFQSPSATFGVGPMPFQLHSTASTAAAHGSNSRLLSTTFQRPQVSQGYPIIGSILNNSVTPHQQHGFSPQLCLSLNQAPNVTPMIGSYSPAPLSDGFPLRLPQILGRPDDGPNLTNHQMLLRFQIEVFEANEDDSSTHTRGRNKPIMTGQVGVRCKHCKHLPVLQRQKGSTYFPNSLMGIYQAVQNMNTVHMQCGLCTEMPDEVKRQFIYSMCNTKVHQSGAGRNYWAKSAKKLGLVDTEKNGIRFIRNLPPGAKVVEASSSL